MLLLGSCVPTKNRQVVSWYQIEVFLGEKLTQAGWQEMALLQGRVPVLDQLFGLTLLDRKDGPLD
jgi:hypothetical protein